jgi:hypothetical protein
MSPTSKLSRRGIKKSNNVAVEKLPDFKATEFGRRISEEMKEKVIFFCNLIRFFLLKRVLEPFRTLFTTLNRLGSALHVDCVLLENFSRNSK